MEPHKFVGTETAQLADSADALVRAAGHIITDEELWAITKEYPELDTQELGTLTPIDEPAKVTASTPEIRYIAATSEDLASAEKFAAEKNIAVEVALELLKGVQSGELHNKETWKSKILLLVATSITSILMLRFGLELDPSVLVNIFTGGGISTLAVIGILRKWFSGKFLK